MKKRVPVVIFSGGSEIVTISLLESFFKEGIPIIVIGLGRPSIIRKVDSSIVDYCIQWPPSQETLSRIQKILHPFAKKSGRALPVFATEDSSLRFLFENREQLSSLLLIPQGCRGMQYGGLDKAEFYEKAHKKVSNCVPTLVIDKPEEIKNSFSFAGDNIVIKPSLKPYSMDLSSLGAKAKKINRKHADNHLFTELSTAWKCSNKWVVQPLLDSPEQGECFFGGIRKKNGEIRGITGYSLLRQPRFGGTACWVKTSQNDEVESIAHNILNDLDFWGICEMEFMLDKDRKWQLLEFNPRSWLQVGLAVRTGINLPFLLYRDLLGLPGDPNTHIKEGDWVNIERLLIATFSGQYGSRISMLRKSYHIVKKSSCKAVYDCPFLCIRKRWLMRVVKRIMPLGGT